MIPVSKKAMALMMDRILGLKSSKIIMWKLRWPVLMDVRQVFKVTKYEERQLTAYYKGLIHPRMSLKNKAIAIAKAVNERVTYMGDYAVHRKLEYWQSPWETHWERTGDCDDYAILICYLLRLFGATPYEVFVRAGEVARDNGTIENHAHVIVYDTKSKRFYPLEGSLYPERSISTFFRISMEQNANYSKGKTWFVTNDVVSYSGSSFKMVH